MVDDSIDVDKLLIRTWHTLPADLGRGQGSHKGRHITWLGWLTCLDVGLGLRRMRHMGHVTRVEDLKSLGIDRGLRLFIVMCDIIQKAAL